MSVTTETLRLARELRLTISGLVDNETRALTRGWARAWDGIVAEVDAAATEILNRYAEGGTPSLGEVRRMSRARNALDAAQRSILSTFDRATVRITDAAGEIVDAARLFDARQIASQLPRTEGTIADLAVRFDRVNPAALEAIVERTTQQVTAAAWPLADDATEAMLRALVQAVPQGLSPRVAARRMVGAVEGRFNGGLARALTVARTEMLSASVRAAEANQATNADVLAGWVWHAELSSRVCPSCVAMHGTMHSLEEPGPLDHQNGRCNRMPVAKSWRDLGFGIDEPPARVPSGEDWFAKQPEATKVAIMGQQRLDALNQGVPFSSLAQRRSTPGWRDSFAPTPIRDLVPT